MAKAKYTIFVPSKGNAARAVRQYMETGPVRVETSQIVSGEPYDAVTAYADDSPEADSHFKQMATLTAQAVNEQLITVVKESKQGVQTWQMRNNQYAPESVHDDLRQFPDTQNTGRPSSL